MELFSDEYFMQEALKEAQKAFHKDEVPVGAVIVWNNQVIARAHNLTETLNDVTAHAEMQAFTTAASVSGGKYLADCTLFVTLEPCIMCAAALVHARVKRLVFGARDHRWGGVGSLFDLSHDPRMNHELEVISGVMEKEAAELLQRFYARLRQNS